MPALVETMFSVREKPWHGLGTIIEDAPTSKEAIRLAGLDWDVVPNPIYDASGNPISGYVANTRSSDGSVLGIVTPKYKIVQNAEAFEFTDSLVGEGLTYETAGSLRNGKQIWLLGKMPSTTILDDEVEPYICFTNTHDGMGSVRVCMTPVRVVCNNTLNLALSTARRSWSAVHSLYIETRLDEARQSLDLIDGYMSALDAEANTLAAASITDADIEAVFDALYPVADSDSNVRKQRVETIKNDFFQRLDAKDIRQYRGTMYGAVMAITDFVDHAEPLRKTDTFAENRWSQIIMGHPVVDQFYKTIKKIA